MPSARCDDQVVSPRHEDGLRQIVSSSTLQETIVKREREPSLSQFDSTNDSCKTNVLPPPSESVSNVSRETAVWQNNDPMREQDCSHADAFVSDANISKADKRKMDEIEPTTSKKLCEENSTTTSTSLVCTICNETFVSRSFYEIHVETHTSATMSQYQSSDQLSIWKTIPSTAKKSNVKRTTFSCTICKSQCFDESHFKIHQLFQTTGSKTGKSLSCEVCWKTFTKPSDLKRHQRIHTGEKPFSCSICNKKFSRADYLKAHYSTHAEKKPFSCNVCKKRFSQSGTLSRHKLTHTEDQPYACNICWMAFADIGDLKLHQFTHNEEKPYSCNMCAEKFDTSTDLNSHVFIHGLPSGERSAPVQSSS